MKTSQKRINRIVGVDMHPDVFTAAFVVGDNAAECAVQKLQDRLPTLELEQWANRHLQKGDIIVMEASGNSFEVCSKLHKLGYTALVMESFQASKLKENYCNDDKSSAIKLAKAYLSGLAKLVWQPDEHTRELREIFQSYQKTVKDTTRSRNRIRSFLSDHMVRLPKGTRLTSESTLKKILGHREWSDLQKDLLSMLFTKLWQAEAHRKKLNQIMTNHVLQTPSLRGLLSLMGIRHVAAFAIGAIVGDIKRFPNPKKLVGYIGLSPRKTQSGNNKTGYLGGIGGFGRKDLRGILIQSAQNALNQRGSVYNKWGCKLLFRKNRNIAAAAVARKIATSIWHLMNGNFTPMQECNTHLRDKVGKLATLVGVQEIKDKGYQNKTDYINKMIELILYESTLPLGNQPTTTQQERNNYI